MNFITFVIGQAQRKSVFWGVKSRNKAMRTYWVFIASCIFGKKNQKTVVLKKC